MKAIALAATFTALAASPAEADCACGVDVLTESVAEGQSTMVIETNCAAKFPKLAILDAAGKSTPVTLSATHAGYSGTTQYVFQPTRALAPGKYTVSIADRYQTTKHAITVVAATTSASPPSWNGTPKVIEQKQTEFGCGPAKVVKVTAGSASLAYVELVDDGTKRRSAGYVPVTNGELSLGHGMCGGAFDLMKTRGYTATITLMAPERGTSSSSKTLAFTYAP